MFTRAAIIARAYVPVVLVVLALDALWPAVREANALYRRWRMPAAARDQPTSPLTPNERLKFGELATDYYTTTTERPPPQ